MQTSPCPKKTTVSKWVLGKPVERVCLSLPFQCSLEPFWGGRGLCSLVIKTADGLTLDKQGLKLSLFAVPLPCVCAVRAEGSNTRTALWYLVIYPVCVAAFGHQRCNGRVGLFLVFSHTAFTLKSGERKESWKVYWRRWILTLLLKNEID